MTDELLMNELANTVTLSFLKPVGMSHLERGCLIPEGVYSFLLTSVFNHLILLQSTYVIFLMI